MYPESQRFNYYCNLLVIWNDFYMSLAVDRIYIEAFFINYLSFLYIFSGLFLFNF